MDFDIANYTTKELLDLLGLPPRPKDSEIQEAVDALVAKHNDNRDLVEFIQEAGRLLQASFEEDTQAVFQADVRRGSINPVTKNTVTRLVNLDSTYRAFLDATNRSDAYTCMLNEPLTNVISMCMYSVEIPLTWYNFTKEKGNTSFYLKVRVPDEDPNDFYYGAGSIPDGNYTELTLTTTVVDAINNLPLSYSNELGADTPTFTGLGYFEVNYCTQDPTNKTWTWELVGPKITVGNSPLPSASYAVEIIWYDHSGTHENACNSTTTVNNNLGWYLGFRTQKIVFFNDMFSDLSQNVITTPSVVNVYGTKYIIIRLDDYKHNRLHKNLVGINTEREKHIQRPDYITSHTFQNQVSHYATVAHPTAPRRLTKAQLFSANAVYQGNTPTSRSRTIMNCGDVISKIPVRPYDWQSEFGQLMVEFSGSLQTPVRDYFGPCNINAMFLGLYDDKGNSLDLNGADWSCTLLVTQLYSF